MEATGPVALHDEAAQPVLGWARGGGSGARGLGRPVEVTLATVRLEQLVWILAIPLPYPADDTLIVNRRRTRHQRSRRGDCERGR